jgi:hypothetical protein
VACTGDGVEILSAWEGPGDSIGSVMDKESLNA